MAFWLCAPLRPFWRTFLNERAATAGVRQPPTLGSLTRNDREEEDVALLLADQRMPEMDGVTFLNAARELHPEARRGLLTAYADTNAAIQAINEGQRQRGRAVCSPLPGDDQLGLSPFRRHGIT